MAAKHVFAAMSGGVDSSVTAFLLKEAGYQVTGVFMKNWEEPASAETCPASIDMADAQAVCEQLHIEFRAINFANEYWEHVFTYFLDAYRQGLTPNPDILCNKEIKFKAFLDYAKQYQADYMATGHYVRSQQQDNVWQLLKGLDPNKDQSYFLYALSQQQLSHSLFPVGHLQKSAVRALAKKLGLKIHAKKDSTGICFIGERRFKDFLNEYLPAHPGEIHTPEGELIGKHDGLMFYTIGQRQGLQIGGKKGKSEAPWYVIGKDIANNILLVAQGEHPALYASSLLAKDLHWIAGIPPSSQEIAAKIRYRQTEQACRIQAVNETCYDVLFTQPQRAITPGQSIVFYQGDICLGGGIIDRN
ncbi:MAG: tRNA 2-thiouridine(34) synthase MnmA [Gammaproteobacteria bacterium RIFCSPHIGHO2_12_FULL_41_20]|nr:MAG: tRNA 2-thiouridine(34) synthase MnmA [Gammaproteobacteria bacterium RIFCSPHIGHO2_12_FULL_41_20]